MQNKTELKAKLIETLFQASKPMRNEHIDGLPGSYFVAAKYGWIAAFYDRECPYKKENGPVEALLCKTWTDSYNEAIGVKNALIETSITMLEGWQK